MCEWSDWYPLEEGTLQDYASAEPGAYQIRLAKGKQGYPNGNSPIVYIGSSPKRSILERLQEHINDPDKGNPDVFKLYKIPSQLEFCQITTTNPESIEQRALDNFLLSLGDLPLCNERSE